VPDWLIWLKYLSWFLYGNEALAINQWEGLELMCNRNETKTCFENGDEVLLSLGFEKVSFGGFLKLGPEVVQLFCVLPEK
jgi:hypothetical protein